MKLLIFTITILSLAAAALSSILNLAKLPDCTESTNGTTLCGSGPSYTNDVFHCNDLHWDLVHHCASPNAPCSNGACTPISTSCEEGKTQCATLHSHGYESINICQNGKWEIQDSCACNDDGSALPRCSAPPPGAAEVQAMARACKKGELKCLAADQNGMDGALFRCNENGMWRIVQDCSKYERCVNEPFPHCKWA
jgi:hypothetical protein